MSTVSVNFGVDGGRSSRGMRVSGCFAFFGADKTLKHVCRLTGRIEKTERLMIQSVRQWLQERSPWEGEGPSSRE